MKASPIVFLPYSRVQAFLPQDFLHRVPRLLSMESSNNYSKCSIFIKHILLTNPIFQDKRLQIFITTIYIWAKYNSHAIQEGWYEYDVSLKVWVGIIGRNVIGPYLLSLRLNGVSYTNFLQEQLSILLENVPLAIRPWMWFLHNGAPTHFSITARQYPNHRIGRAGAQPWPPKSTDLNPLDFCIWGHLKSSGYFEIKKFYFVTKFW